MSWRTELPWWSGGCDARPKCENAVWLPFEAQNFSVCWNPLLHLVLNCRICLVRSMRTLLSPEGVNVIADRFVLVRNWGSIPFEAQNKIFLFFGTYSYTGIDYILKPMTTSQEFSLNTTCDYAVRSSQIVSRFTWSELLLMQVRHKSSTQNKVLCINLCHSAARSCSDLIVLVRLETFFPSMKFLYTYCMKTFHPKHESVFTWKPCTRLKKHNVRVLKQVS